MEKINDHLIELQRGKKNLISLDKPLKMGDDVDILVHATVDKILDEDNHDGTINRIYMLKGVWAEES